MMPDKDTSDTAAGTGALRRRRRAVSSMAEEGGRGRGGWKTLALLTAGIGIGAGGMMLVEDRDTPLSDWAAELPAVVSRLLNMTPLALPSVVSPSSVSVSVPLITASATPVPPVAVPAAEVPQSGDWMALNDGQRQAVARTFGYGGEVREGKFARYLDAHPDLRADFDRRFLPAPQNGDWMALNDGQRQAVARTFGYDGEVREGKFARYLDVHPDLRVDFDRRFLSGRGLVAGGAAVPSTVSSVTPPPYGGSGKSAVTKPATKPDPLKAEPVKPVEVVTLAPTAVPLSPAPSSPSPSPASASVEPAVAAIPGQPSVVSQIPGVKPVPPPPSPAAPPAVTSALAAPPLSLSPSRVAPGYAVQVGSYQDPANAQAALQQLLKHGYRAYAADWVDTRQRRWRVVRVGNFPTPQQAREAGRTLAAQGFQSQIIAVHEMAGH